MTTGREILQARLLVNWSLQQLARAARLPFNTVTANREAFEAAGGSLSLKVLLCQKG